MCDEFDYRILTMEQRDATMIVMSRAFCTQPLSLALPGTRKVTDTVQVFDWYMDECVKRQLSMIAIDTCSHRVAGACLLRDHTWRPQCEEYLKQWVENKERPTAAVTGAVLHAEKMACNKLPILEKCQDGDVIDIWCVGVHPDYRGRKIASNLIAQTIDLAKRTGYRYAVIVGISAHTSKIAERSGFTLLVRYDARTEYLWEGVPVFAAVEQPHGFVDIWVLELTV